MSRISGTKEWAEHNVNCVNGCSHNCRYCYAKTQAIRFKRKTADNWNEEVLRPLPKSYSKKKGRIMFPTTHDITPENMHHTLKYLEMILASGNDVLVVSKPHVDVIEYMCKKFRGHRYRLMFRFTIGSANDNVLKLWEPGAPCFSERLQALRTAYNEGYQTSVSCEPMLDNHIEDVIEKVEGHVTDAIWLGKMNRVMSRLRMNGADEDVFDSAYDIIKWQIDGNIRKLYDKYKDHPKIKWKESIKEVVGIPGLSKAGEDR